MSPARFLLVLAQFTVLSCSAARTPISAVRASSNDTLIAEKQSVMQKSPDYGIFREILDTEKGPFRNVFAHPDSFNLQIIYTQIDRDKNGKPRFTEHQFRAAKDAPYFYPASTVKMPVAILALQRLRELNLPGLDRNSAMITDTDFSGQTPVLNDPSTPDGRPSLGQYVKKIFLVSDNDAFNRLYEFLGPHYINRSLQQMGYAEAEIIHRLEISLTEEENRHTNPIRFLDPGGKELYRQPGQFNSAAYAQRQDRIGLGYYRGGVLQQGPMDFSRKNRIRLSSLNSVLKAVMFPEAVPPSQRFFLDASDYQFLRQWMSALPRSSRFPSYDSTTYYDTYCKFLLFGSEPSQRIPAGMKVFNKVGDAYGHLIDVAYVADAANGVEFMLSVVIYANRDGILNDNQYDYDTLGFPLMKYIGERIYFHERARKKEFPPDLSWIKTLH